MKLPFVSRYRYNKAVARIHDLDARVSMMERAARSRLAPAPARPALSDYGFSDPAYLLGRYKHIEASGRPRWSDFGAPREPKTTTQFAQELRDHERRAQKFNVITPGGNTSRLLLAAARRLEAYQLAEINEKGT